MQDRISSTLPDSFLCLEKPCYKETEDMLDTACLALTGQGTSLQVPGTAQAKAWKLESEAPAPGWGSTGTSCGQHPGVSLVSPHPVLPLQAASPVAQWSGVVGPAVGHSAEAGLAGEHTEAQG